MTTSNTHITEARSMRRFRVLRGEALINALMLISAVAVGRSTSVAALEPNPESGIELETIPC